MQTNNGFPYSLFIHIWLCCLSLPQVCPLPPSSAFISHILYRTPLLSPFPHPSWSLFFFFLSHGPLSSFMTHPHAHIHKVESGTHIRERAAGPRFSTQSFWRETATRRHGIGATYDGVPSPPGMCWERNEESLVGIESSLKCFWAQTKHLNCYII